MPYPCPVCGFEVFDEPAGSYETCPACGWDDDAVQLRFPHLQHGSNEGSLWQWQQAALQRYPLDQQTFESYHRCPDWRPLTPSDCGDAEGQPITGSDYLDIAALDAPAYYWRPSQ
ncbi:CPCC family cysteine-rich protein [Blastopirellula retiformator]|nr:CPCC family cysteine-rich protein [Blastopirellula retiformator]